jgi:hypothetical protein
MPQAWGLNTAHGPSLRATRKVKVLGAVPVSGPLALGLVSRDYSESIPATPRR